MNPKNGEHLSFFARWLRAAALEAEALMPEMLDLPAREVHAHLTEHPEVITAALIEKLLAVARYCLDRHPTRALELTQIAVDFVARARVPVESDSVVQRLRGAVWKEHSNALSGRGRLEDALDAVALARKHGRQAIEAGVLLARIDLAEAQIRIKRGEFDRALSLTVKAAATLLEYSDDEAYVTSRMTEALIWWKKGDNARSREVLKDAYQTARRQKNATLRGRILNNMAVIELRRDRVDEAIRLFRRAHELLSAGRLTREIARVRWNLAEALGMAGKINEAISELYQVRRDLLCIGAVLDAANVSTVVIDYLRSASRESDIASLARENVLTFRDAGLVENALEALTYIRSRAEMGDLTEFDTAAARRFLEDLPQDPKARFVHPD